MSYSGNLKVRPGKIVEINSDKWEIVCDLCCYIRTRPTYQEASISLTAHLDRMHEGWDAETPANIHTAEKSNII